MPIKNKEKRAAYMKQYFSNPKNYNLMKKRAAIWMRNHPECRSTKKLFEEKEKLFIILGGKICKNCGYNGDFRALQFDHINGGGTKERKTLPYNSMIYYYSRNPEEARKTLQVLCANCNRIKMHTNNEFSKNGGGKKYE